MTRAFIVAFVALLFMQSTSAAENVDQQTGSMTPAELYQSTVLTCIQPQIDQFNAISSKKKKGRLDQIVLVIDDILCVQADNISWDFFDEIKTAVESSKVEVKRMVIASPGGDVSSAIQIGKLIRQRNISVFVWGLCLSSCANYIFLAAHEKYYGIVGRSSPFVGFHGAPRPIEGRPSPVPQMHLDFFAELGHTDEMTYQLPCNLKDDPLFHEVQEKAGRKNVFWMFPPEELEIGFGVKGLKYDKDFSYPVTPGTWRFPGVGFMPVEGGFIGLASCPEDTVEKVGLWDRLRKVLFGADGEADRDRTTSPTGSTESPQN